MTAPRFRPEHRPASRGPVIVMNTGMTRLNERDWSVIQPDGTRKPWVPQSRRIRA